MEQRIVVLPKEAHHILHPPSAPVANLEMEARGWDGNGSAAPRREPRNGGTAELQEQMAAAAAMNTPSSSTSSRTSTWGYLDGYGNLSNYVGYWIGSTIANLLAAPSATTFGGRIFSVIGRPIVLCAADVTCVL